MRYLKTNVKTRFLSRHMPCSQRGSKGTLDCWHNVTAYVIGRQLSQLNLQVRMLGHHPIQPIMLPSTVRPHPPPMFKICSLPHWLLTMFETILACQFRWKNRLIGVVAKSKSTCRSWMSWLYSFGIWVLRLHFYFLFFLFFILFPSIIPNFP